MLEQLSKTTGKSRNLLLFEFQKDKHPITFKRWLKEEQLRKTGKLTSFVNGKVDKSPIIELINNQLVEVPFPEGIRNMWGVI